MEINSVQFLSKKVPFLSVLEKQTVMGTEKNV